MTLKQFGIRTTQVWNGTLDAYVLAMLDGADDQILIDLGQHVGYEFKHVARRVDPPFWRKGMFRVFLSHLAAHRAFAGELQENLLKYGISCFVAHNDIEPTSEWQTEIETALATCEALIALLHERFHESMWTDQEIGFAMGRGVPSFAIHLGQVPYGFIGRFQAFNGNGKGAADLAADLFNAYRKHKQTQQRMAEVLVALFEQSGSFAEAKQRINYLEDLEVWDPSFSARISSAAKSNSQISGAWRVGHRAEALVYKWHKS